jgi:lipoprotein-releasing system ATP-binding protein
MSDELERMLRKPPAEPRPLPITPRTQFGPRVRGGPSLEGGPKLEPGVPLETNEPPAAGPAKSSTASSAHTPLARQPGKPHMPIPSSEVGSQPVGARPHGAAWQIPAASTGFQLEATGLKKSYRKGSVEIPVLRGVDLGVRQGEFLAIVGQSGSGKSTLLHLLGTLDAPDEGTISFGGQRIDNLRGRARDTLRNRYLGMVFQFYHLLPELTTLENVLSPLMIHASVWGYFGSRRRYRATATRLLEMVGLGHRLTHRPRELSGGEMQRAAIARALVARPELLLADEPTGNLDRGTGQEILEILRSLNRQEKLTIVMVTHDVAIAEQADRIVRLTDGRIE